MKGFVLFNKLLKNVGTYCPGAHCTEHGPPAGPLDPALQVQAATPVLPAGEKEFAGQPTQPEEPVPPLYVPPKHCVHVPPSGPVDPALQMQAATAVLPAGESEFVGQPRQGEGPVADLYVPPKHCVHVPPLGPLDPALQMQAVIVVLTAGELDSAGQFTHEFELTY